MTIEFEAFEKALVQASIASESRNKSSGLSLFSHLEDFRVLGRNTVFRYKAKAQDPQRVGKELGIGLVVTGRILRLDDRVIIRAESLT